MAKSKSFDRDKHILGAMFLFLFSISFALILIERVRTHASLDGADVSSVALQPAVQGVKETQTNREQYRALIKKAALLLFKNAEQYTTGEESNALEVESAHGALLVIGAPELYQSLHFDLVRFSRALLDPQSYDQSAIIEQYYGLLDAYPWLIQ